MTSQAYRRIALGLDGAVEGSHMGHPDFRAANGRIFAGLYDDGTIGSVGLTPDEQADFLERAPGAFSPAAGAWGRGGWTIVKLAEADEESVGEALTLAWRRLSAAPAARSKRARAKTARRTPASQPRRARKRPS